MSQTARRLRSAAAPAASVESDLPITTGSLASCAYAAAASSLARTHATSSCDRSRNSSQTSTARQPRLQTASIANALTGMPASIEPGSTSAVRSGSPSYS